MRIGAFGLLALAAGAAFSSAAEPVTNSLASWGSSVHDTFNSAYYWVPVGSERDTSLKDESKKTQPLDPTIDYVVYSATVFTPRNTDRGIVTFNGRSLTLGRGGSDGFMRIYSFKDAVVVFDEPGLFLNRGICYTQAGGGYKFNLDGVLTVNAPSASPFRFMPSYASNTLNIFSLVHGGSGTGIQLDDNMLGPFAVRFLNPLSDYAGSIDVKPASSGTPGGVPQLSLELADLSVGPVSVGSLSAICPASHTNVATVSQLTLAENSVIGVKVGIANGGGQVTGSNGCLKVTESLTLPSSGKVYVRAPVLPAIPDGKTERIVVLKAPFGSIDKAKFELVSEVGMFSMPCELDVTSDATAGDELAIVSGLVVLQTVSDQNNNSANSNGTEIPAPNSITNELHWSDGQVPHAGAGYLVDKINGAATCLRTSYKGPSAVDFGGDSLTIGEDCRLWLFNTGKFTVKSLTVLNGAILGQGQWTSGTRVSGGIVNFPSGTAELSTIDTHHFYIDSELRGAAELLFKGPGSSSPQAHYHFTTNSPLFKGTVFVKTASSADDKDGKERNQKIYVSYADSLGGPLDAFNPKAWTFQDLGELIPENSMVFDDLTRGFYYGNRSRLTVAAGKEADFLAQRTFDGELFVRGGGVVGLGGSVKFGAAFADAPTNDVNRLTFVAGDLKALSAGCVDGLVVTFADAASKVIIPADTTDAELLAGGIRNVKTDTPFVFAGDKLNIELGLVGDSPIAESSRTVGLLTVKKAAADALRDKISVSVPKSVFCHRVSLKLIETTDDAAGTVTFAAECCVNGLMLIVK